MLESHGISVETLDLSEVLGRIQRMKDGDDRAQAKLEGIKKYVSTSGVPAEALLKMAKLAAVVDDWMKATDVAISAVQCWTSIEENLGVVPCTVMSMMSNDLMSSACEVDICGVLAHACAATGVRYALGAAGLEQQLRRRPEQGGLLPLLEPAEALFWRSKDGLPGDHRRARWELRTHTEPAWAR